MATLLIDKRFGGGVGRIQRRSGTNDSSIYNKYLMMLDQLEDSGRHDILIALKNKTLDFAEVYGKWRTQNLNQLNVVQDIIPLKKMQEWIDGVDLAADTKRGYTSCLNQLLKVKKNGVVSDLPEVLKKYRDKCVKDDVIRSFNQSRALCQSYISHEYGRHTPLWMAVSNIKTIKRQPRQSGNARPIKDVMAAVKKMGRFGEMFLSMTLSGMGPKEYYGKWEVKQNHIHIHGTKRDTRNRIVPLVGRVVPPSATYKYLRLKLKEAEPTWVIYDGRRSFAHILEMSGIPMSRIQYYLGHATASGGVTGLYLAHDPLTYIDDDRTLIMDYLTSQG